MEILEKLFHSDSMPVFSTKEEMHDLLQDIKLEGEDWRPIWEIYLTLRWHIQSQNGDCLAKESLRILRQELHAYTQLLVDLNIKTSDLQNQTIRGRKIFYPRWAVVDLHAPFFSPKGMEHGKSSNEKFGGIRACCERFLSGIPVEPYPFLDLNFVNRILELARAPLKDSDEDSIRSKKLLDYLYTEISDGKYELVDYPKFYKQLGFWMDSIGDGSSVQKLESEQSTNNKSSDPEDSDDWIEDMLCVEEDGLEESEKVNFCLPGLESILAFNFFHMGFAARHELYPHNGFQLVAESDNTELQTYLAFALARMDFQKHLPEIFSKQCKNRSVGRDFEELPILFAIELMQAGHISKAVEMITGEGAEEALLSGDKSLFTSIMCLPTALKKSREGSYCTVFAYACSRLPELLPDKNERDKALNSLERFVFNDSFLVKHLHPAIMLCALIGAMLRSGEFDRADQLQAKLNSLTISKEIKNKCGFFYLDAAVFWYLNGSVSNMIEVISRLLSNHIQGVSQ
jgi:hypothetical protein